ncbi:MAG: type I-E CRISPR-associated protein Cas6/Cse3/CasE [Gammaproteobacteria bacterium]
MPLFYVLSRVAPHDTSGKRCIEPREYRPDLRAGDMLAFKLRANPVSRAKKDRDPGELDSWRKNREKNGLSVKDATWKRIRHGVIMNA